MVAIGRSPGRVNLIGEHTDYNEGFVLPIALPHLAIVTAVPRTDDVVTVSSEQIDEPVSLRLDELTPGTHAWWAYVAGVLWVLRDEGRPVGGVDLTVDSVVPLGAGLSSSAALESAAALALSEAFELDLDAQDLARVAQRAENDFVGVPTGPMDQRASLWGRSAHALLLDCRDFSTRQVPFDLAAAGLALVVTDTKTPHALVDGEYAERRASCAAATQTLGVRALRDVDDLDAALGRLTDDVVRRRVRHVVTENERVEQAVTALEAGDWAEFGRLMDESHASMRDDYEITVPTIDLAQRVARGAGALGARLTGGGFGGCVISIVPVDQATEVADAVAEAFAAADYNAPVSLVVTASPGGMELAGR